MSSIKKIVLEVGGVELSLTPEDAKTLQAALNELFQKKEVQLVPSPYPVYPSRPYWYEYSGGLRLLSMSTTAGSTTSTPLNLSTSSFRGAQ